MSEDEYGRGYEAGWTIGYESGVEVGCDSKEDEINDLKAWISTLEARLAEKEETILRMEAEQ